jgi:uncharacterized membrane protein
MNEYVIGIGLMIIGAILFFTGRSQSKKNSVNASGGSVAVGRDNSGPITNTNIGSPQKASHSGGHTLTIIGILVEVAGIAVTIWHAMHLAAK